MSTHDNKFFLLQSWLNCNADALDELLYNEQIYSKFTLKNEIVYNELILRAMSSGWKIIKERNLRLDNFDQNSMKSSAANAIALTLARMKPSQSDTLNQKIFTIFQVFLRLFKTTFSIGNHQLDEIKSNLFLKVFKTALKLNLESFHSSFTIDLDTLINTFKTFSKNEVLSEEEINKLNGFKEFFNTIQTLEDYSYFKSVLKFFKITFKLPDDFEDFEHFTWFLYSSLRGDIISLLLKDEVIIRNDLQDTEENQAQEKLSKDVSDLTFEDNSKNIAVELLEFFNQKLKENATSIHKHLEIIAKEICIEETGITDLSLNEYALEIILFLEQRKHYEQITQRVKDYYPNPSTPNSYTTRLRDDWKNFRSEWLTRFSEELKKTSSDINSCFVFIMEKIKIIKCVTLFREDLKKKNLKQKNISLSTKHLSNLFDIILEEIKTKKQRTTLADCATDIVTFFENKTETTQTIISKFTINHQDIPFDDCMNYLKEEWNKFYTKITLGDYSAEIILILEDKGGFREEILQELNQHYKEINFSQLMRRLRTTWRKFRTNNPTITLPAQLITSLLDKVHS